MNLSSAVITFFTEIYDLALLGIYTININYSWNGPNTLTKTFNLTVTDPCLKAFTFPVISNISHYLNDTDTMTNIAPNITPNYE